jgi:hypothetical protein
VFDGWRSVGASDIEHGSGNNRAGEWIDIGPTAPWPPDPANLE